MVRGVLGDQLGGASRGVTRLSYQLASRRQAVGGNEAGGEVARDPGSEMVEQGGGGRYRWLNAVVALFGRLLLYWLGGLVLEGGRGLLEDRSGLVAALEQGGDQAG